MQAAEHIYVHIPFCHRVCPYCAFYKHTPGATNMRGFVEAVAAEARLRLPEGAAPRTLYFGGGTPSMLSPTHLSLLVEGLRRHLDFSQLQEWSFEANPATFTRVKAEHWHDLGITRISLGAQSFDEAELKLLGREHSPNQIEESIALLRQAGIPQVNIDLMFCLPGQTPDAWSKTLRRAIDSEPNHISTYSLTLESGTPFASLPEPNEETQVSLYTLAHELLTAAGYQHYEVSNYAKSSLERSLHNIACWIGQDYIGLGPGACGTTMGARYENAHDTTRYIAALSQGQLPPGKTENLTLAQRRTELIGLGLRTDQGIPLPLIPSEKTNILRSLADEGLCHLTPTRLCLTPRGFLLADEIALQLI